jgi:hypothetical protein
MTKRISHTEEESIITTLKKVPLYFKMWNEFSVVVALL